MAPLAPYTLFCVACETRTTKQCSGCRELRICSPECQRLVWSTHKWLCRNKGKPFSHAPLTDLEIAWLLKISGKAGQVSSRSCNWAGRLEYNGWCKSYGVRAFLRRLAKDDCPVSEPLRSFAIAELRGSLLNAHADGLVSDTGGIAPFEITLWMLVGAVARNWKYYGPDISPEADWHARLDVPLRLIAAYAALKYHPDHAKPDVAERKFVVQQRTLVALIVALPPNSAPPNSAEELGRRFAMVDNLSGFVWPK